MKTSLPTAVLMAALASTASAQTPIDSVDLSGSTLTGIHVGTETFTSLIAPTSFVDNKGSTDYIHLGASAPGSLAEAIGSFDPGSGSLNHSFEVQFGQTLFGAMRIYLILNENDATFGDSATVFPIDSAGNRLGGVSSVLNFNTFGALPVLGVDTYNRTTDGTPGASLDRTIGGIIFTLDDLGIGGIAGTEGIEVVTTTLDPQEIGLAPVDPTLVRDTAAADPDLDFGSTFLTAGAPAETAVRTVRFINIGPTQDVQVNSVTAPAGFTITDVAKNGTGGQTTPFTLAVNDSIEVSVKAQSALTGPDALSGTVTIDTDQDTQDQALAATAVILARNDLMNRNPAFLTGGGTATDWLGGHARVTPGLTPGSGNAVRIFGQGDPGSTTIGRAAQVGTLPDGAPDFESVFVFTPVSDFTPYVGAGASGDFADRGMQYLLYSTDSTVGTGTLITDLDVGNILVNLAYMPDGVEAGGIPGFYVFDGTSGEWQLAVAKTLAGSTDTDLDGILDPAAGDSVEAYRVAIRGIGFGSPGASYDITVSTMGPAGLTGTMNSGPVTSWHGVSGETATVAAHSFTSADDSDSNTNGGFVSPFWIDSSAVYYGEQPDGALMVVGVPGVILADGDVSPVASVPLTVRNDGDDSNLSIDSFDFTDGSFSVAQSLPASIAPGASTAFDLEWDSSLSAPHTAARASFTVGSSDDSSMPALTLTAGLTSSAAYNPNFNFEALGTDAVTDSDTFLFWNEGASIQDVPGLLAGSATCAHVNGGSILGTSYVDPPFWTVSPAWTAEAVFAIGGTNGRVFNFKVREELVGENYAELNIRYEASKWQVFDGIPGGGGAWVDLIDMTTSPLLVSEDNDDNGSLDDVGDVKIAYRLRVSGSGWTAGGAPMFSLEVSDASGNTLGAATGRTELLNGFVVEDMPTFGPNYLEIRNTGSEFWVDDVVIATATATEGVEILSISGGPGGFTIVYDAGGADVVIERSSPGLDGFSEIASGENSGVFTDHGAPAGKAFYRISLAE